MKRNKFLSVIAVSALLVGAGLTSCSQEPQEPIIQNVDVHHFGVSISTNEHGKVTSSAQTAKVGEEVTLTVAPNENAHLVSLKVNGTDKTSEVANNSLKTSMVENGVKVEAVFALNTYKVSIAPSQNGTVEASKTEGLLNETITFKVTPTLGYTVGTFEINGIDKASEIKNGTFETTLPETGLSVSATFIETNKETRWTSFKGLINGAIQAEQSGETNSTKKTTITKFATTEELFEKFASETEGNFALTTTISKNKEGVITAKSRRKVVRSNEHNYALDETFKVDAGVVGTATTKFKTESNDYNLGKESIDFANKGKGYLNDAFNGWSKFKLADFEKEESLKVTVTEAGYVASYEKLDAYGAYEVRSIEATLTDGKVTGIKNIAKKWLKSQITVDETTKKVTINEGAEPNLTHEEYALTFGDRKVETAENKTQVIKELLTKTISTTFVEKVNNNGTPTEIPAQQSNLLIKHDYFIKLEGEKDKIVDAPIVTVTSGNIVAEYSDQSNSIYVNALTKGTAQISVQGFNFKQNFYLSFNNSELTGLTLQCGEGAEGQTTPLDTATCETGDTVSLTLTANDAAADETAAFVFEGDNLGCKVAKAQYGAGFELTTSKQAGTVKLHAVSIVDSSIISNTVTITIEPKFDVLANISGTYRTVAGAEFTHDSDLVIGAVEDGTDAWGEPAKVAQVTLGTFSEKSAIILGSWGNMIEVSSRTAKTEINVLGADGVTYTKKTLSINGFSIYVDGLGMNRTISIVLELMDNADWTPYELTFHKVVA